MIKREIAFFAVNGLISVTIAYSIYHGLIVIGMPIELANGMAYLAGMVYGFFANKYLAFRNKGEVTISTTIGRYALLHAGTLLLNVVTNSFMLEILSGRPYNLFVAFVAAIGISTICNFIGMKYWVFKRNSRISDCNINTGIV